MSLNNLLSLSKPPCPYAHSGASQTWQGCGTGQQRVTQSAGHANIADRPYSLVTLSKMANYRSAGKAIQLLLGPATIRVCISHLEIRKRMRVTGLTKVNNNPTCGESRTSNYKSSWSSPKWSPGGLVPLQGLQNHQPKYTA